MIDRKQLIKNLPRNGMTVVHTGDGKIISVRSLSNSEHIATVAEFIEIARAAGYKCHIVIPNDQRYTAK
ncbi:hypothetical protein J2125_004194 [Erwinia toletana]|uniref:Phage protein n=1 Tax=Winslowiella toletana TaxID=92490 RepID=A0ABS4PEE7_9GAMM|nr:hypothetical protein [Winslowiella toletana]MBP2171002.1 hypothetical protein [Winslowiella toletana]